MAKFRKKPVTIEAEQWFPGKHIDGVLLRDDDLALKNTEPNQAWIQTLEGGHIVSPGDWIITGVEGEKYPCKPHIFEKTYTAIYVGPASEPRRTVLEIIATYLRENGYDGLCKGKALEEGCGCLLNDLAPCGEPCMHCEPGYQVPCDCEQGCQWHVSKEKEDEQEAQAPA